MSEMFIKIKYWYEVGFWNISRVKNAVVKKKITEEEYKEITGEDYSA